VSEPEVTLAHDPAVYLDRAVAAMALADGGPYPTPSIPGSVEDLERITKANQTREMALIAEAQAWASMATAAAMLQPTPEEVLTIYRETHEEVLGEENQKAVRAAQILRDATTDGSRRHPAIHAALEVLDRS